VWHANAAYAARSQLYAPTSNLGNPKPAAGKNAQSPDGRPDPSYFQISRAYQINSSPTINILTWKSQGVP
jgi:hypothetical protein